MAVVWLASIAHQDEVLNRDFAERSARQLTKERTSVKTNEIKSLTVLLFFQVLNLLLVKICVKYAKSPHKDLPRA